MLKDKTLKEDERVQFDIFYQQCSQFIDMIRSEYRKKQVAHKKKLLQRVSFAALAIGAVTLTYLFVQQRKNATKWGLFT